MNREKIYQLVTYNKNYIVVIVVLVFNHWAKGPLQGTKTILQIIILGLAFL